ncbi:DNA-entry nuclease [Bacillus velezensis]|uniref:DNA-entry nuclease n=1 Tax=Bacillus TaxID=1386 RepID=UPI001C52AD70|nr:MULTISPECIES: DNA-entry nuclease [Bacillus amyloliquefaciens group]QXP99298.1 DNA-entry nuclease [Bacillus velezensis]UHH01362.1 DNA-entry nuclease [Bacillus amyloliquefaciens]ULR21109.1 DNA-entry nuclease [Bacillus velezensis]UVW07852.1 DNA-entry nuclease [Bacillus velezensis]WHL75159.1 DNA-entry nuclease [Bacillus velezensis]
MEAAVTVAAETYEYDVCGRMKYHPDFHFNHGKKFSESDLEYLCKYYDSDHAQSIAFALGKTEHVIKQKVSDLRKSGRYEHFKNMNKHW